MKYRKKLIIYSLLAGLTVSISSCRQQQDLQLLHSLKGLDFPSASATEFHNGKLYVFGDDAPYLLILNSDYQTIDTVFFWEKVDGRISKKTKHDIEAAMMEEGSASPLLFGIGSRSNDQRLRSFEFNINQRLFTEIEIIKAATKFPGITATNIEGATMVGKKRLFANRANLGAPQNYLLMGEASAVMTVKPIHLPKGNTIAGISGLEYDELNDLLLFTASEEATASATADGAIGHSYLGWIENFSSRLNDEEFHPDGYRQLNEVDPALSHQKIESVCVEKATKKELVINLAADNDDGTSSFFKLQLLR